MICFAFNMQGQTVIKNERRVNTHSIGSNIGIIEPSILGTSKGQRLSDFLATNISL
jgi:hypothetical protein